MHSLMIGTVVVLMAVWLLFLPLRLAIDLQQASNKQVGTLPAERAPSALDSPTDDVEQS